MTGLAAFGVGLSEALELLRRGSGAWLFFRGNISLSAVLGQQFDISWHVLVVVLLGIVLCLAYSSRRPIGQALAFAVVLSVLVSPISWVTYGVILLPIVVKLFVEGKRFLAGRVVALVWFLTEVAAIWVATEISPDLGRMSLVFVRLALLTAVAFAPAVIWQPANDQSQ